MPQRSKVAGIVLFLLPIAPLYAAERPWKTNLSGDWRFPTGDNPQWASPDFDDSDWEFIHAPALWDGQGYADYDGFGWYRKKFFVPAQLEGKPLLFQHGGVDDDDWVYINGVKIGEGRGCYKPRSYLIPPEVIRYGDFNLIAIRIYDGAMGGGLARGPLQIREVTLSDRVGVRNVELMCKMGSPTVSLRFEVASLDGRAHEVLASVEVVDFFLWRRLLLKFPSRRNRRFLLSFPSRPAIARNYRVYIRLKEGRRRLCSSAPFRPALLSA